MTDLPPSASVATPIEGGKLLAPSALRNIAAVVGLVRDAAPTKGRALEIASGTGQHIVGLASALPQLDWFPSEVEPKRIASINAYADEAGHGNLHPARLLDAATVGWAKQHSPYDMIYLGNLLHLVPDEIARSIISQVAQALTPKGVFVLYGPFMRSGALTSDGDAKFHAELRASDPDIGYKDDIWIKQVLTEAGLPVIVVQDMPANNLGFIARREAP